VTFWDFANLHPIATTITIIGLALCAVDVSANIAKGLIGRRRNREIDE
jgi:hypothetical protein